MSGAAWVKSARPKDFAKRPMSPAAERVAELLDEVFSGIYHISDAVCAKRVDWTDERYVEITLLYELATFDFDMLTRLVLLAHEHAIRVSIEGCGPRRMRVMLHPRRHRAPDEKDVYTSEWHPTIEQAVARIVKRPEGATR